MEVATVTLVITKLIKLVDATPVIARLSLPTTELGVILDAAMVKDTVSLMLTGVEVTLLSVVKTGAVLVLNGIGVGVLLCRMENVDSLKLIGVVVVPTFVKTNVVLVVTELTDDETMPVPVTADVDGVRLTGDGVSVGDNSLTFPGVEVVLASTMEDVLTITGVGVILEVVMMTDAVSLTLLDGGVITVTVVTGVVSLTPVGNEVALICVLASVLVSVRRKVLVLSLKDAEAMLGPTKENVVSPTLTGVDATLFSTATVVLLLVVNGDGLLAKVILTTL